MQLKNPKAKISVRIDGAFVDIEDSDLYFSIDKDLSEEPNEAEFIIHNLKADTRGMLSEAARQEAPVEFYATTIKEPEGAYKLSFAGEIDNVKHDNLRPGFETRILCTSQKRNHREFWFQKTYSSGTFADEIISDLLDAIGLPKGNAWESSRDSILLSKTFAGPAYELLQRFMFDRAMYCYIMDGKIYSSLVSVAPSGIVKSMNDYVMAGDPEEVVRSARNLIEMKTVIEVTGRLPDALKANSRRKRRRKKNIETYGKNDYVQYEAVEQDIPGYIFPLFHQPDINPDDIIGYGGLLYRTIKVHHEGQTFGGQWDTTITTDIYDDTGGDFI